MKKLKCHVATSFRNLVNFINENELAREDLQGIYIEEGTIYLLYYAE